MLEAPEVNVNISYDTPPSQDWIMILHNTFFLLSPTPNQKRIYTRKPNAPDTTHIPAISLCHTRQGVIWLVHQWPPCWHTKKTRSTLAPVSCEVNKKVFSFSEKGEIRSDYLYMLNAYKTNWLVWLINYFWSWFHMTCNISYTLCFNLSHPMSWLRVRSLVEPGYHPLLLNS